MEKFRVTTFNLQKGTKQQSKRLWSTDYAAFIVVKFVLCFVLWFLYPINFFKLFNLFQTSILRNWAHETDECSRKLKFLVKIVFDDNNQERKSWSCLRKRCCRSLIVFLSLCWASSVAFGDIIFRKLMQNQLFGLESCAVLQDTFNPHQVYDQVNCYKKSSF